MTKVSILIPVFNSSQYLKQCINSAVNQSYKNLEIILVDDGSTDKSSRICDEYGDLDNRIKVVHKENGGVVSARKSAVKNATGDFVFCLDSDDYIDKTIIDDLISLAHKNDADVVIPGYIKEKENGPEFKRNILDSNVYKKDLLESFQNQLIYTGSFYQPGVMPFICNKLIKRELYAHFQQTVPDEIFRGEDVAVMFPLLECARSIVIVNEIKAYHYRRNILSICHNLDEQHFERKQLLYCYLENKLKKDIHLSHLKYYELFGLVCGIQEIILNGKQYSSEKSCYIKTKLSMFKLDKSIFNDGLTENNKFKEIILGIINEDFIPCIENMKGRRRWKEPI